LVYVIPDITYLLPYYIALVPTHTLGCGSLLVTTLGSPTHVLTVWTPSRLHTFTCCRFLVQFRLGYRIPSPPDLVPIITVHTVYLHSGLPRCYTRYAPVAAHRTRTVVYYCGCGSRSLRISLRRIFVLPRRTFATHTLRLPRCCRLRTFAFCLVCGARTFSSARLHLLVTARLRSRLRSHAPPFQFTVPAHLRQRCVHIAGATCALLPAFYRTHGYRICGLPAHTRALDAAYTRFTFFAAAHHWVTRCHVYPLPAFTTRYLPHGLPTFAYRSSVIPGCCCPRRSDTHCPVWFCLVAPFPSYAVVIYLYDGWFYTLRLGRCGYARSHAFTVIYVVGSVAVCRALLITLFTLFQFYIRCGLRVRFTVATTYVMVTHVRTLRTTVWLLLVWLFTTFLPLADFITTATQFPVTTRTRLDYTKRTCYTRTTTLPVTRLRFTFGWLVLHPGLPHLLGCCATFFARHTLITLHGYGSDVTHCLHAHTHTLYHVPPTGSVYYRTRARTPRTTHATPAVAFTTHARVFCGSIRLVAVCVYAFTHSPHTYHHHAFLPPPTLLPFILRCGCRLRFVCLQFALRRLRISQLFTFCCVCVAFYRLRHVVRLFVATSCAGWLVIAQLVSLILGPVYPFVSLRCFTHTHTHTFGPTFTLVGWLLFVPLVAVVIHSWLLVVVVGLVTVTHTPVTLHYPWLLGWLLRLLVEKTVVVGCWLIRVCVCVYHHAPYRCLHVHRCGTFVAFAGSLVTRFVIRLLRTFATFTRLLILPPHTAYTPLHVAHQFPARCTFGLRGCCRCRLHTRCAVAGLHVRDLFYNLPHTHTFTHRLYTYAHTFPLLTPLRTHRLRYLLTTPAHCGFGCYICLVHIYYSLLFILHLPCAVPLLRFISVACVSLHVCVCVYALPRLGCYRTILRLQVTTPRRVAHRTFTFLPSFTASYRLHSRSCGLRSPHLPPHHVPRSVGCYRLPVTGYCGCYVTFWLYAFIGLRLRLFALPAVCAHALPIHWIHVYHSWFHGLHTFTVIRLRVGLVLPYVPHPAVGWFPPYVCVYLVYAPTRWVAEGTHTFVTRLPARLLRIAAFTFHRVQDRSLPPPRVAHVPHHATLHILLTFTAFGYRFYALWITLHLHICGYGYTTFGFYPVYCLVCRLFCRCPVAVPRYSIPV